MPRQLRREDYTVGWVCALPVELAAAKEMLDEEHGDLPIRLRVDRQIGNNLAAAVATQMRATFKGIWFGLMVGIGGGTGLLNSPLQILLIVVARVQANELWCQSRFSKHVSKLNRISKFQHGKAGPNVLFKAIYDHEGGQTFYFKIEAVGLINSFLYFIIYSICDYTYAVRTVAG
ncbi:hypothetical protein K469DRAFT_724207 [Zopfia rhizophila CBS 207.26]|uniref:Uncharacterized protein n=1 Tax=Zopfia rhizophila CBS 207.26 TaxID=1314779 RepID=A0A6A6EA09_9PEZI|nr:hypothetical protein K469DRAFT_724207 [Zopfia rhizophila CBS 207.26]